MAKSTYNDLIFQLGDLARAHLSRAAPPPRLMKKVFAAEDKVVALREAITTAETEMNEEDETYKTFTLDLEDEKREQQRITKKYAAAVSGVESRSRSLKKKLSALTAALKYQHTSFKLAEANHRDLEQREGHDLRKLATSGDNLKKFRLQLMRDRRTLEELQSELESVLTPRPGQQGAAGITAHRRLLELEDEAETRAKAHEQQMKDLDEAIAGHEVALKAAESALDSAIFGLGEEVYGERVAHTKLSPLYASLDRAGNLAHCSDSRGLTPTPSLG